MNLSQKAWRVRFVSAPLDISLMIQVDCEMSKVSLTLHNAEEDCCFTWQEWSDTTMGLMRSSNKIEKNKLKSEHVLTR